MAYTISPNLAFESDTIAVLQTSARIYLCWSIELYNPLNPDNGVIIYRKNTELLQDTTD